MNVSDRFRQTPGFTPSRPSAPAPLPEAAAQGEVTDSSHVSAGLVGLAVLGAAVALTGCTQPTPVPSQPQENTQPMADPRAEILAPGTPRIDLHRETTKDSDDKETNVPYSPVGIHLGGGVFQDTAGNISLVPELAFGEDVGAGNYTKVQIDGPGWSDLDVTRSGGSVNVDGPGWSDFQLSDGGAHAELKGPGWAHYTFDKTGTSTKADGPGWSDYSVSRNGNTLTVDLPGWNDWTVTRNGETITVDGPGWTDYTLTRNGNTIHVDGPGWADTTITRDGTTRRVDGPGWDDYNITRDGNTTRVDGPGFDDYTLRTTR